MVAFPEPAGWTTQVAGLGLLHFASVSALPFCVGLAIQAVVDGSGAGLAVAGGLMALCCAGNAVGDTFLHRAAVTNWITAAARVQQLLARKTALLGSALTRRVAAGEVVAVSTGDVEKIGWFVEAVSRFTAAALTIVLVCAALVVYEPALGVVVVLGLPVLALAVLPLLPGPPGGPTSSARRPAAPPNSPRTPSPGCGCCAASAARNCSSTATAMPPRRCATLPCAAPACGP